MKKFLIILIVLSVCSCDDGNIDLNEFIFENITMSVQDCNNQTVLSKINENEALIIQLNIIKDTLLIRKDKDTIPFVLTNNGSHTIVYRIFDDKPTSSYFCQSIPPSSPKVVSEWLGSGTLTAITILDSEDDNDGIDEPNNLPITDKHYDTDNDGIPNFRDNDDDGDGILTIEEGEILNTDGDEVPNYLDDDDDGDGIPTIEESKTASDDNDDIPNYLDSDDTNRLISPNPLLPNIFTQTYHTEFNIKLLKLIKGNSEMNFDTYNFGNSPPEKKEVTILP